MCGFVIIYVKLVSFIFIWQLNILFNKTYLYMYIFALHYKKKELL